MPSINEFTQGLVVPQYAPTNYSPELEIQVAIKQQKNYDRILNTVKGLQSQALNIQMLNQEGRQRLEKYNKEILTEVLQEIYLNFIKEEIKQSTLA